MLAIEFDMKETWFIYPNAVFKGQIQPSDGKWLYTTVLKSVSDSVFILCLNYDMSPGGEQFLWFA